MRQNKHCPALGTPVLYVSDLDGTLLDNNARLPRADADALHRLIAGGTLFTVATARTGATVQPLLQDVGLNLPAIVMTGAALWHCGTQTYTGVQYLPADLARRADAVFAAHGVHPFVYALPGDRHLQVYNGAASLTPVDRRFWQQRRDLPLKTFHLQTPAPDQTAGCRVLYFASGTPAAMQSIGDDMRRAGCAVSVYDDTYNPGTALVEVFAPGVSKAHAVQALKKSAGAGKLVVFGDNLNDLPMMAVADMAVAVANAHPGVLAAADTVTGPNTAGAVPRFIAGQ